MDSDAEDDRANATGGYIARELERDSKFLTTWFKNQFQNYMAEYWDEFHQALSRTDERVDLCDLEINGLRRNQEEFRKAQVIISVILL